MPQPHKQISEEQKKIKSEDTNLLEMQFQTIAACGPSSGFLFLLSFVVNQKTLGNVSYYAYIPREIFDDRKR